MSQDGGLPDNVTDHDIHEAWGRDCPEDRGLDNEMCQECSRFNECKRKWPHIEDCKCFDCEIEREAKREKKQLDEFDTYEAKQEAGKFGKRSKGNQDDRP